MSGCMRARLSTGMGRSKRGRRQRARGPTSPQKVHPHPPHPTPCRPAANNTRHLPTKQRQSSVQKHALRQHILLETSRRGLIRASAPCICQWRPARVPLSSLSPRCSSTHLKVHKNVWAGARTGALALALAGTCARTHACAGCACVRLHRCCTVPAHLCLKLNNLVGAGQQET